MVKMSFNELNNELSEEELLELENAAARTIAFDDESPEMTPEMLRQFNRSYGKGYTSFLSRLIDAALDDATLVKRCL